MMRTTQTFDISVKPRGERSKLFHWVLLVICVLSYIAFEIIIISLSKPGSEIAIFRVNRNTISAILTQAQVIAVILLSLNPIKRSPLVGILLCAFSVYMTMQAILSKVVMDAIPGVIIPITAAFACVIIYSYKEQSRRSEQKLILANEIFQKVLDTIPMPIFWKDLQSNFLGCNQFFARESGKSSPDELIGKDDYSTPSADQAEKYRADDAELMRSGQARINYEEPHTSANGDLIWVRSSKAPLCDANGKVFGLLGVYEDITKKKLAEQELYYEKERLRITLLSIGDAVMTTDQFNRVTLINSVAEELTGWSAEEALGKPVDLVLKLENEITGKKGRNPIELVLREGKTVEMENHTLIISKNGEKRAIEDSAAPIHGTDGDIQGVVMVFRDVTDKKIKQDEILYLSYHDSLTNLYNRRYVEEKIKRIEQTECYPLSIILGDVNGLKMVNDVLGHYEGDRFLIEAAGILKKSCRPSDIVARWGGDEFIVLLPNSNAAEVEKICGTIKTKCTELADMSMNLSISLGYATRNNPQEEIAKTINTAEEVMYTQKMLNNRSYRNSILESFRKTLFEKSHETEEHANRLMLLSKHMGQVMNLPQTSLQELELLGVLHDIGKIGIPDSILNKPGKLDEDEWVIMKRHAEIGSRIAQSVPEFVRISDYILSHHERWDGNGYPRGLKGADIPVLARILCIVDSYDAMTSERAYRKPMTQADAIEELVRNAGKQFDPDLVQLFVKERIYEKSREVG